MAVQKARDTGRISVDGDGRINFESADAAWLRNTNVRQSRPPQKTATKKRVSGTGRKDQSGNQAEDREDGSFLEAQRQREWERVKKEKLQRLTLEGKLLDTEKVREAVAGMIIDFRTKALVIGDELADKLAATADPIACRELVDSRIHQALESLAEYPANAK